MAGAERGRITGKCNLWIAEITEECSAWQPEASRDWPGVHDSAPPWYSWHNGSGEGLLPPQQLQFSGPHCLRACQIHTCGKRETQPRPSGP
jgi:hypothetical protein